MKNLATGLAYGLVSLAVVCGAMAPVAARDRPGTPTDLRSHAIAPIDKLPEVFVTFRNTASESVNFWVEWKVNKQQHLANDLWRQMRCADHGFAQYYSCRGLPPLGARWTGQGEDAVHSIKGFLLVGAKFDTEYCFRFKAHRRDGVVSEFWSAWSCTRTPAPPPRPVAPGNPQATLLPAVDGRGQIGPGSPSRLLIEWDRAQDRYLGWYVLESLDESSRKWLSSASADPSRRIDKTKSELTIDLSQTPTKRVNYRLCAENIGGRSCSVAFTYRLPGDHLGTVNDAKRGAYADRGSIPGVTDAGAVTRPVESSRTQVESAASAPATGRSGAAVSLPAAASRTDTLRHPSKSPQTTQGQTPTRLAPSVAQPNQGSRPVVNNPLSAPMAAPAAAPGPLNDSRPVTHAAPAGALQGATSTNLQRGGNAVDPNALRTPGSGSR